MFWSIKSSNILIPTFSSNFFRPARYFHNISGSKMKLITNNGNLSSLKILAACSHNNQSIDIKTVSKKGIHDFLFYCKGICFFLCRFLTIHTQKGSKAIFVWKT